MKSKNINKPLFFGFTIQIALMLTIVLFNLNQIEQSNLHLKSIVKQSNVKMSLAYTMHNAARERFILINNMIINDDPFQRSDYLEEFYDIGNEFLVSRNKLYETGLSQLERSTLDQALEPSQKGSTAHHKIISLIQQQEEVSARRMKEIKLILQNETFPAQLLVKKATQDIVNLQKDAANNAVIKAEESYKFTYKLMILLGESVVIISFFIAWFSIRSSRKNEALMHEARNTAEEANKSKGDFLAVMTHELRTPLTSLIGYNELLAKTKLDTDQLKILKIAMSAGKTLLYLINNILDFSKIVENKMEFELHPFRLDTTCNNMLALMQDSAEKKELELSIHCDKNITTGVIGDQFRLQQVITNLLSNAIKFTDKGSINLIAQKINENELSIDILIAIQDSGIGMSMDTISQLFDPFKQADTSISRRFGGTGLGLTVSKKIIAAMGGNLIAHSDGHKGSTFSFILTFGKCSYDYAVEINLEEANSFTIPHLSGRVLIVEDTVDIQVLVKFIVNSTGASATIANNGKEAIKYASKNEYDLILMDMQMPIMNGLDATQHIRETDNSTPIVALTANSSNKFKAKMISSRCTDILNKPIDQIKLYAVLSAYLSKEDGKTDVIDPSLANEMLNIFIPEFIKNIDIILIAFASKDIKILKRTFHKIKGNAGSYGFPEISELAICAEKEIETNDFIALEISINKLTEYKADLTSGEKTIDEKYWE